MTIKNPWCKLSKKAQNISECDEPFIEVFNKENNNKKDIFIQSILSPEPFLGNPNAEVVFLQLNPGFKEDRISHDKGKFKKHLINSIQFPYKNKNHFYLSDDSVCSGSPGQKWWRKTCKYIAGDKKVNNKNYDLIAENLFSVEYFPYHSKKFGHGTLRLPSQEYSFYLVRKAIERNAYIICGRGKTYWYGILPQLSTYDRLLHLKNPRVSSISEKNSDKPSLFKKIRKVLLQKKSSD